MKNIIIGTLVALCVVLLATRGCGGKKKRDQYQPPVEHVKQLVETEVKRVNKKIDNQGFEHAVINEVANTVNNLAQLSDSVKRELDSVTALLGIKEKQIKQYIRYSSSLKDSLLKATKEIDNGDTTYTYRDEWASITYVPSISGGHFNFSYDAEANYAEYWKRSGLFGAKKHYIDFWISDSRVKINGVNRVKIETQKKPSTLRVNALAMYNDGVYLGVDGQVRLGSRYWVGGGYVYDVDVKSWRPIFTTRLSLLEF